ncbi:hypothetical protein [Parasitella parasitica]|nr:hypothetical protein [Parasitella parasitica]
MHLGTTSTSRIEGAHAVLKRHLKSAAGDLGYVFNCMDTVLKQQHTDINVRSKAQQYKANNQFRTPVFSGILRSISRHPLQMAFKKFGLAKVDLITTDQKYKLKPCTGSFEKTQGIPCAHTIKECLLQDKSLEKEDFHRQWYINESCDATSTEENRNSTMEDPFSTENVEKMKEM